jgi:hypothetical protein
MRTMLGACLCNLILLVCFATPFGVAHASGVYPAPASFADFRFAQPSDEIDMARSAAPASISSEAEVLTLGAAGYETAAKGKNGFVCLIERSWAKPFSDPEFWDSKLRAPICFNPAAAHSVLPVYLQRTRWALAGVSKDEMLARTRAAIAAKAIGAPEPGSMSYMMSKQGHIAEHAGHWYSHVMFFMPHTEGAAWGANALGSPIFSADDDPLPVTIFFVLVSKWSDGSPASPETH